MDALEQYLDHVDALIAKLSPAQQRQLAKQIGNEIRQRNARRIKANIEPDGSAMAARQGPNLRKLRTNGRLQRGQEIYYMGRFHKLDWSRDHGEHFVGGASGERPAHGFLKSAVMLRSTKARPMFRRLALAKWLKSKTAAGAVNVGFWTGAAGRIAAEQQAGTGKTAARELLGFAPDDISFIEQKAIEFLAENL